MAAGKWNMQKASGGVASITVTDGTTNTDLVLPESGTLVSVGTTVTDNAIARYDGTTGKLQNSGVFIDDSGNVGIGTNSTASSLTIKDGLTLISQFGNSTPRPPLTNGAQKYGVHVGITNADDGFLRLSAGGGSNYSTKSYIDISGYSTVSDMYTNIVFGTSGTERMRIDSAGNLLLTSGTGALGYGAGAGGTVTQLTSKSTAVTLNKPSGLIITHNEALAPGASVEFFVYNNLPNTGVVIVQGAYTNTYPGNYKIETVYKNLEVFIVRVTNITNTTRYENVEIKFVIINESDN